MMVEGYKCFNGDLSNNYGFKFEVGKTYKVSGKVIAGVSGNGYHMCKRIEDTFRYYGVMNPDILICRVIGRGEVAELIDEYNGYYDIYAVEEIEIGKILLREEIIEMGMQMNEIRVIRFIQGFKLNIDEIELFESKFANEPVVLRAIDYYQKGLVDVYENYVYGLRKVKDRK